MKKLLLIALVLFSCNTNKTYKHVEYIREPDLVGKGYSYRYEDPVIIEAKNDEDAYAQAYEKFAMNCLTCTPNGIKSS